MKEKKMKVSKMKVSEINDERVRELLYELCAKTYIKGKSWKGSFPKRIHSAPI